MASFDTINVVGMAYRKTWEERSYWLRMAMIPFFIKLACVTILATYFEDASLWVTGIVLLPAFLTEGWMLSHWARTIMTDGVHRWPFRFSGNEEKDIAELSSRGRAIMAGTVSFALINFLIAGYAAALFSGIDLSEFDPQNPDSRVGMIGMIFIVTSILLFRFIWVYIPLSMNVSLDKIIKTLQPMALNFRLFGVWLICAVPAVLMIKITGEMLLGISGESDAVAKTGFLAIRMALEIVKNLIVTAGMAYVFLILFKPSEK